jgi:NAD-dependent epimerase/dehydratase family protein
VIVTWVVLFVPLTPVSRHSPRCVTACELLGPAFLSVVRILFAGATGVLGRATLPHIDRAEVVGLTRSPAKLQLLRALGAEGVVCDVYDDEALLLLADRVQPQIVVNFVTDLTAGSAAANNRVRREGGRNLLNAARAAAAERLVVESVAFALHGDGAQAVSELEQSVCEFPHEGVVLRFGRLWGPGTLHETPPQPPTVHIDVAGVEAAKLIVQAPAGIHEVV